MSRGRIRFRLGKPITISARFPSPNFSKKASREKNGSGNRTGGLEAEADGCRTVGKSVRIDSHEAGVTPLKLGSIAHALALAVCLLFLEHIQSLR
jgi:hypothetical protein